MKIHIVKEGDTLYALSQKYGVTLKSVVDANPQIVNPDQLKVGEKVKIPAAASQVPDSDLYYKHTVKQGDTLWKLSKAWGIPLKNMIDANPQLKNPNALLVGEVVNIPKKGTGTPSPAPHSNSAVGGAAANPNPKTLPGNKVYTGPKTLPAPEMPAPVEKIEEKVEEKVEAKVEEKVKEQVKEQVKKMVEEKIEEKTEHKVNEMYENTNTPPPAHTLPIANAPAVLPANQAAPKAKTAPIQEMVHAESQSLFVQISVPAKEVVAPAAPYKTEVSPVSEGKFGSGPSAGYPGLYEQANAYECPPQYPFYDPYAQVSPVATYGKDAAAVSPVASYGKDANAAAVSPIASYEKDANAASPAGYPGAYGQPLNPGPWYPPVADASYAAPYAYSPYAGNAMPYGASPGMANVMPYGMSPESANMMPYGVSPASANLMPYGVSPASANMMPNAVSPISANAMPNTVFPATSNVMPVADYPNVPYDVPQVGGMYAPMPWPDCGCSGQPMMPAYPQAPVSPYAYGGMPVMQGSLPYATPAAPETLPAQSLPANAPIPNAPAFPVVSDSFKREEDSLVSAAGVKAEAQSTASVEAPAANRSTKGKAHSAKVKTSSSPTGKKNASGSKNAKSKAGTGSGQKRRNPWVSR